MIYEWLSRFYVVHRCTDTASLQQGVSAIIRHKASGNQFLIEVKNCEANNVFIELIASSDPVLKLGWVYTCQADWLLLHVFDRDEVLFLKPNRIRDRLNSWMTLYPHRTVGKTRGLIVPLRELRAIAAIETTIEIETKKAAATPL